MLKALKKIPRSTQNILAAALLAGLAAAGILAALRVWPFGDSSLLTGDLNGMYVNFFADLKDRLLSGGLFYSTHKMAGGSTLGLFAYYMASPLNLLFVVLPKAAFPQAVSLSFVLRAALAAGVFCFFVQRHLDAASRVFAAAGLCWALCAFFIIYNQNVIWMDAVIMLPAVLWGIDELVRRRRVLPFTLLLAATIVLNFYTAFSICIFSVLYFVYSYIAGNAGLQAPPFFRALARFAACGLLAAALSMVLLLPALTEVLAAGDVGSAALTLEQNFPLYRLPERLFPGTFFWGDVIDGLPNLYCGLSAMLLGGAYFAARRVPLREKLAAGGILLVLLLSMWLQGPDLIWQGLKPPTWFPHRYSFLFSAFLLLLACRALLLFFTMRGDSCGLNAGAAGVSQSSASHHRRWWAPVVWFHQANCRRKALLAAKFAANNSSTVVRQRTRKVAAARDIGRTCLVPTAIVLAGAAFIIYTVAIARGNIISLPKAALAAAAVLGTAAALWLHTRSRPILKKAAVALLCLVMAADVTANALLSIRKFQYYPHSGFVQYTQNATATLATLAKYDSALYRVETVNNRTLNDPMLVGYMGISHYSSLMPGGMPRLREQLGYVNLSVYGYGSTALADSLLGVRYLYGGGQRPAPAHWQELQLPTPFPVWQNPYAFPLAYTAPADILNVSPPGYTQNTFALQNAIAGALSPGAAQPLIAAPFTAAPGASLSATITAPVSGPLYFALPYSGQPAGDVSVNGQPLAQYFSADTLGAVLCLGRFAAGEEVELSLNIPATPADVDALRAYALDESAMAALAESVNRGAATALEIKDGGAIRCTAAAQNDNSLLVLSLAYEDNWQATINGQPAQLQPLLGGLMALPLHQGENTIELHYSHPGAAAGLAITLFAAALLALWVLLRRKQP